MNARTAALFIAYSPDHGGGFIEEHTTITLNQSHFVRYDCGRCDPNGRMESAPVC